MLRLGTSNFRSRFSHPWCSLGLEVAQSPASPAHLSVAWPSRLAHRVIRRHRRPLRGQGGGARLGLLKNPGHRLTRCVTSGTLAGARRELRPHRSVPPFGETSRTRPLSLPLLVLPSFLVGPLSRVSPAASGSCHTASVPKSLSGLRLAPGAGFHRVRLASERRSAWLRPRGATLPAPSALVVGSTSTVCSAAGLRRVAVGAGSGVREVGSGSSVGAPLSLSRGPSVRRGPGPDGPSRAPFEGSNLVRWSAGITTAPLPSCRSSLAPRSIARA